MTEENQVEELEGGAGEEAGGGRRRFVRRPRVCQFCAEKTEAVDYKQSDVLRRYITEQGRIRSRRETGTCARHQRMLSKAIKRSRHMALLPFRSDRFR
jgi:small subunit ribosomal protein S18